MRLRFSDYVPPTEPSIVVDGKLIPLTEENLKQSLKGYVVRDPNRIDTQIEILRAVWKKYPDWRLGQVIANAVREATGAVNCDPFYLEDSEMEKALRALARDD